MHYLYTPHVLPLVFTAFVTAGLALFLWSKRTLRGAVALMLLLLIVTVWVAGYCLELLGADLSTKLFWARFVYAAIVFLPLAWIHFAIQFIGKRHDSSKCHWLRAISLVVPVIVLIMVWTPSLNGLIWSQIEVIESGPFLVMDVAYGPVLWVFVVFAYSLFLYGSFQLVEAVIRAPHNHRTQTFLILIAAVTPIIGNLIYLLGFSPIEGVDISVYGFAISGLALTWAVSHQQVLDLLPIARTVVVESMHCALIVLDQQERVVDYNQAALEMLAIDKPKLLGQSFGDVFAEWPQWRDRFPPDAVDYDIKDTIKHNESDIDRWLNFHISKLFDADGKSIGYLLMAHDNSDMVRTQQALQRRVRELVVLHAIASAGVEINDEDILIEKATHLIGQSLYPDSFGVLLVNKSENALRMHSSYNVSEHAKDKVIPLGQGITGRVALTGKMENLPNVNDEPAYICGEHRIRSELCVPLMTKGNIIGVVNVESVEYDAFDQFDENLLSTFASQLAVAVERARLFKQTRNLAITDELTGLHNRRHFFTLARKEFHRARRYGRCLSAIMLDFDKFKQINDTYGHATGDNVLRTIARCLSDHIRDVDIIGRYGGEEFGIILPETDFHDATIAAERLRRCAAEQAVITMHGVLSVTISLGVAVLTDDVKNLYELLDRADQALLRAKNRGRNQVEHY
jgi:diguanylate cyclase (GGDEF)-like protein